MSRFVNQKALRALNGSVFNVTAQPIASVPSPTTFTIAINHANIGTASDTGDVILTAATQPQVEYAILG